jgi:RNA polymerase sigma factor (sigma-70 family)
LATVATNRWIDRKRKQNRHLDPNHDGSGSAEHDHLANLEAPPSYASDDTLVNLLRDCLKAAFGRCASEARVLLRLVYLHELSQREIVQMLGWSESKVSRFLSQAMKEIEKHTLAEVKKRDPWLELSWRDFVDLCETHQIGFL